MKVRINSVLSRSSFTNFEGSSSSEKFNLDSSQTRSFRNFAHADTPFAKVVKFAAKSETEVSADKVWSMSSLVNQTGQVPNLARIRMICEIMVLEFVQHVRNEGEQVVGNMFFQIYYDGLLQTASEMTCISEFRGQVFLKLVSEDTAAEHVSNDRDGVLGTELVANIPIKDCATVV